MFRLLNYHEQTMIGMKHKLNIAGLGGVMKSDLLVAVCQWTKQLTHGYGPLTGMNRYLRPEPPWNISVVRLCARDSLILRRRTLTQTATNSCHCFSPYTRPGHHAMAHSENLQFKGKAPLPERFVTTALISRPRGHCPPGQTSDGLSRAVRRRRVQAVRVVPLQAASSTHAADR